MGLLQDRNSGPLNGLTQASFWLFPLLIALVCSAAAGFGEEGRDLLRYDRQQIADGEFWRLLSGHIVHLGVQHLILNIAGLILVWVLVGRQYTIRLWALVTVISLASINAGFWFIDTDLAWYVGLSGLLHGLLLAGAIPAFRDMPLESAIIVVAVIGKLVYEQIAGPLPGSEATAGGTVVTNAHLYGGVGGILSAACLWRSVGRSASI